MVVLPFRRRGRRLSGVEPNYVNTIGAYYSDIGTIEAEYVNTIGTYYSDIGTIEAEYVNTIGTYYSDIGISEAEYVNANPYGLDILLTVVGTSLPPNGFEVTHASSYDSTTKLDRYSVNIVDTLIVPNQRIQFLTNAPSPLALNTDYWVNTSIASTGGGTTPCYLTIKDAKVGGNVLVPATGITSNIIRYAEAF